MKSSLAVIGQPGQPNPAQALNAAAQSCGLALLECTAAQPREALQWAMALDKNDVLACILVDSDGRHAAALSTAVDPAIPVIVWAPAAADPARLTLLLADSPVLFCFAATTDAIVQILAALAGANASVNTADKSPASQIAPAHPSPTADQTQPSAAPRLATDRDPEDQAILYHLENLMALPVKSPLPKSEPQPIHPEKPVDFSVPLRQLMTAGREIAQQHNHAEVTAVHYLAALPEHYHAALQASGLSENHLAQKLESLERVDSGTAEASPADSIFLAVAQAKEKARQRKSDILTIPDFLEGLLDSRNEDLADLLEAAGTQEDTFRQALASVDASGETSAEPFFKPSSLDQAGFYEFDEDRLQRISERLQQLPGFQKASERVAEARPKRRRETAAGQLGFSASDAGEQPARVVINPAPPAHARPAASPPDKPQLFRVSGEFPDVDVIEQTADLLLEGHILAFPADTMLAVAVDATNATAVEQLRALAGLPPDKPLAIMINSTSQLKHLARTDVDALEPLLDELWPGPLTLVFKSGGAVGAYLARDGKLAVRQPQDNISLSILSMLGRPLAVTSWNRDLAELTGKVGAIIDAGAPPPQVRTTIADISEKPWKILREGAIPGGAVLGFET